VCWSRCFSSAGCPTTSAGGRCCSRASRRASGIRFYVVAYASFSIPAVLAGVVVTRIGLDDTFEIFGVVVSGLALIVAFEAWRSRPAR
jgi:hypothetical protein